MNASLHSIVSAKIHDIYVMKYKLANGDEYYARMRLDRYTKKQIIYDVVTKHRAKQNCPQRLFHHLQVATWFRAKETDFFKLSDQVTEDEILDTKNYGTIEHKYR